MTFRVSISDLRIQNGVLMGDLEYFMYGLYVPNYVFDEEDVVEQDSVEAWIDMDENKLYDISNVY
jgi:hypothetical protein